jgi:sugar phosphate isomerase/epimerase
MPKRHLLISRRRFIAAVSASILSAHSRADRSQEQPAVPDLIAGIQLAWLGPALKASFDGTLRKISEMGYRNVELLSDLGRTPGQLVSSLRAHGLQCDSRLFWAPRDFADSQSLLAQQIEFAEAMGLRYLVVLMPSPVPLADGLKGAALADALARLTLEDYKRQAEFLNTLGAQTKKAGIQLAYHNFNAEFRLYDGKPAYDYLLDWTDGSLVKMEMDCGWVASSGMDPVRYLRDYPERFPLLHLKDVRVRDPNTVLRLDPIEVGSGIVNWDPLLAQAVASGVKKGYVEFEPKEPYRRPLLESANRCLNFLRLRARALHALNRS